MSSSRQTCAALYEVVAACITSQLCAGKQSKSGNLTTYSDRGEQTIQQGDSEIAEAWFDQAAEYWKQAIALTPGNYIEAQNWLKITRRFE